MDVSHIPTTSGSRYHSYTTATLNTSTRSAGSLERTQQAMEELRDVDEDSNDSDYEAPSDSDDSESEMSFEEETNGSPKE
jgi:hypothetical protein